VVMYAHALTGDSGGLLSSDPPLHSAVTASYWDNC